MGTKERFLGALATSSCEVDDDVMYFYTKFGDFVSLNLSDGKMKFKNDKGNGINTRSVFKIDGRLYRIDNGAEKIIEIDTGREIGLIEAKNCGAHIQFAEKYNSNVSILYGNGMLFYDIDVKEGNYCYKDLRNELSELGALVKGCCNFCYSGLHGKKIYIFQKQGGYMLCYDLQQDVLEKYKLPAELGDCQHIAVEEDTIYVLNRRNEIYQWKNKNSHIELVWKSKRYEDVEQYFGRIHLLGGKFIVLPWLDGEDIVIVDHKKGQDTVYEGYPKGFGYIMGDQYKYVLYAQTEKEIFYPMRSSSYVLNISKSTGEIRWIMPVLPREEKLIDLAKNSYMELEMHHEVLTLDEYLSIILHEKAINNQKNSNMGADIWRAMKQ